MSRICRDCGVADWQPCQCAPLEDNGLDPRVNPYQAAERRRSAGEWTPATTREDHMPEEEFDTHERDARPPEAAGQPFATHVVIPLTIVEPNPAAGTATAQAIAAEVSALIERRPNVDWPTSRPHAAHVLAVNLVTSLAGMTLAERLVFFANLPDGDRARLRSLLGGPQG